MQQNLQSALQAYIKGSVPSTPVPTSAHVKSASSKQPSRAASKAPSRVTSKVPSRAGSPGADPADFRDTLAATLLEVEHIACHEVARLENVVHQLRSERDGLLRDLADARGLMPRRAHYSSQQSPGEGEDSAQVGTLRHSMTEDLSVAKTQSQSSRKTNNHVDDVRFNLLRQARKQEQWGAPDSSYGNLSQFASHAKSRGSNSSAHHHRRQSHSHDPADGAAKPSHHHHHHHRRKSHSHGPLDVATDSGHLGILPLHPHLASGRSSLTSAINEINENELSPPSQQGSFVGPSQQGSFVGLQKEASFGPVRSDSNRLSLPGASQELASYRAQCLASMENSCTSMQDVIDKLEKEEEAKEIVMTDIPGRISIVEAVTNDIEAPLTFNKRLSGGLEPPAASTSRRASLDVDPPVTTSRRVSIECDPPPAVTSRRVSIECTPPMNGSRRVSIEVDGSRGSRRPSGFLGVAYESSNSSEESSVPSDITRFEILPLWVESMLELPTARGPGPRLTRSRTSECRNFDPGQDWGLAMSKSSIMAPTESYLERWVKKLTMSPTSPACVAWELVSFFMIAYDFVVLPLQIFTLQDSTFSVSMEWAQRIFWTVSIPFCFFVGYMLKDGKVELRPPKVRRHYATRWFPFDFMVVVSDWVEVLLKTLEFLGAMRLVKTMRISRIFRMVRVVRTVRLPSYLESLDTRIFSEKTVILMGIAKISVLFVGLGHLIACSWYGIGRYGSEDGQNGWVQHYEYVERSLLYRYSTSLHWALTQFISSMEIYPQNVEERCFANVMLLCSFMVTAWFVSSITARLTRLQIIAGSRDGEFAVLRQYLWHHKISTKLAMRVVKSAQQALFHHMRNLSEKEVQLLSCVSEPLRAEMHYEMHYGPLSIHPFFKQLNGFNYHSARGICHTAVQQLSVPDLDLLFSAGEVPRTLSMYFVASGLMLYSYEGTKMDVTENMWACEGVLWTNWVHLGDLCAQHEVVIFSVDADVCRQVLTKGSREAYVAANYAKSFVEYLNENWEKVLDVNMEMENECWILEAIAELDDGVSPQLAEARRQSEVFSGNGSVMFGNKSAAELDLGRVLSDGGRVGGWCK